MLSPYEHFVDTLREAFVLLDQDGFIQHANPEAATLMGYEPGELHNKHVAILYKDKQDSTKAEYELKQALRTGKYVVKGWKTRKDNSTFWAEMSLSTRRAPAGEMAGYCCLLRNVTARKELELDLRQSEERFRLMVEGVRDYSIFMLDPGGHIVTWNDGAQKMKGYTSYEIIGKHFSVFYTSDDLESDKPGRELKTAIETGKYEEEGRRVRKKGSLFWVYVVLTALYNDKNELIGFSKVTRDLTEHKENEESLSQSEERFRSLVEQVTDYGIFMLDEKGRIVSWNEGAKKMKGYRPDEIIGKHFSIFYPEEDIISSKPAHELKVARTVGKYEEEGWRIRKDGSTFWANVVITAVYKNGGVLLGYSKVTRDLTERMSSERALRESYEHSRKLNDELSITNQELTLANQELEQFNSIVSHDLQEPVRTLKSFLTLMEMKLGEQRPEDLKTYLGKSIQAANRMRELIQNLLQYAQVGRSNFVESRVMVDELIHRAMQNVRSAVDTSGAELVIENEVESVYGDSIQLVQLLQNLLSNALKFTDNEAPRVTIRVFRENGHAKFAVQDNGIGIAQEDTDKVFEIFKRLNTKKDYPGTGIGLSICKKIVDRHGGRIWFESEKGLGTTFYFTLNLEKTGDPSLTVLS